MSRYMTGAERLVWIGLRHYARNALALVAAFSFGRRIGAK